MLYKTKKSKTLFLLLIMLFLAITFACSLLKSTAPASTFKPGDPTATPLGTDITDPNFIKGIQAYQAQKYDEVISLMSAVIDANPNLAPPYYYRGIIFQAAGKNEEAIQDLKLFLTSAPASDDYQKEVSDAKARLVKLK